MYMPQIQGVTINLPVINQKDNDRGKWTTNIYKQETKYGED
jgi:hypothetical protein